MVLPYGRQVVGDDDIAEVVRVLKSDYLTTGPEVPAFEAAFAAYVGAPHAVACSNGTAALHIIAMALGLAPGDQVIVPTISFVATANAVRYCGADVVFADVDPDSGHATAATIEEALARTDRARLKA
ncbi:MAG: aminotransferase class I/II-fold pyridoxal phosphate-dependent enzyme, partial [Hyphomicrobiaceae bacterium]